MHNSRYWLHGVPCHHPGCRITRFSSHAHNEPHWLPNALCGQAPADAGGLPEDFQVDLVGPVAGPARSSPGTEVIAQAAYADASAPGIAAVPCDLA
jgi:hypothetical protein